MSRLFSLACVAGIGLMLFGCGKDYVGDQRFPLEGTATFGGEPIDVGSITLIPNDASATSPSGGVIQDGKYTIVEAKGPNAGSYKVQISWLKKTGKKLTDPDSGELYDERVEGLPPKFHKNTELIVEFPAPENKHDFDLQP